MRPACAATNDFQEPYLRATLGFIGIDDIAFTAPRASPTGPSSAKRRCAPHWPPCFAGGGVVRESRRTAMDGPALAGMRRKRVPSGASLPMMIGRRGIAWSTGLISSSREPAPPGTRHRRRHHGVAPAASRIAVRRRGGSLAPAATARRGRLAPASASTRNVRVVRSRSGACPLDALGAAASTASPAPGQQYGIARATP